MTDTDALLATIRGEKNRSGLLEHANEYGVDAEALAALDSLAAELERVKAERDALTKALETPRRYDQLLSDTQRGKEAHAKNYVEAQARLDKALSALREIAEMFRERDIYKEAEEMKGIARAAIAEIEGEA